ncbi:hypothetical protein IAT38_002378 [Cryptococcus sp. DSM 104549]
MAGGKQASSSPATDRRASLRRSSLKNDSYYLGSQFDIDPDEDYNDAPMKSDDDEAMISESDEEFEAKKTKAPAKGERSSQRINGEKRKRVDSPAAERSTATRARRSLSPDYRTYSEEEYLVDYIVDARIYTPKGPRAKAELQFKIHWVDYGKEDETWEPASNIGVEGDEVVDEFYEQHPKKPRLADVGAKKAAGKARPVPAGVAAVKKAAATTTSASRRKKSEETMSEASKLLEEEADSVSGEADSEEEKARPTKRLPRRASGRAKPIVDLLSDSDEGMEEATPKAPSKATSKKNSAKPPAKKPTGKAAASAKKPPAKKRRVEEDEESDFVMESSPASGSDDGLGEEDVYKSDSESIQTQEDDDIESDREIVSAKTAKKGKPKARPKVVLKGYDTGVLPLKQKLDPKAVAIKGMSEDLPPLHDVEAMFDDIVKRMPDIVQLVKRLNGRKLRVATMCSGTESPLLALNMIAKAIKAQHGLTLSFDHVFSCEIEPFKQAYIERNFQPPILFRDVTELGGDAAHTAYGSVVEVPGNVDVLVAGTSCVDYSNLNNAQQSIDANGESGRTFRGMIDWVKKHKPPVVILENVCSAPWDKVELKFHDIGYDASYTRLDTKEFYIPHTRTRGYLFATPQNSEQLSHKWLATVKDLRRPWSSPFEAFLLQPDDPNIHRARLELASARANSEGSRKTTDWGRCESRHQRARNDEELGLQRPLTAWQDAGVCRGLDWTWNDWLFAQTPRVLDLLDISTLRMAKDGIDSGFKACIWNVSQNVDRQSGSSRTALAPCLTPNMIPWVTTRGGPVTGREALALQGIPVRELLLTSETEDQLSDLAGNAMSTTVVGSALIAALRSAGDKFEPGTSAQEDEARVAEEATVEDALVANRIVGEDLLEIHVLDLAKVTQSNLLEMMDFAKRSSRHCQCEGQTGTALDIAECTECGYRACKGCGGRPEHVYAPCKHDRIEPVEFEKRFKELLPMRVQIAGLSAASLEKVKAQAVALGKGTVDTKDWKLWSQAVLAGVNDAEFRFRYLKRQSIWTAVYEAPGAELELVLEDQTPEWRLSIKAPASEPNNSRIRTLLIHPVARLRFDTKGQDVLCGPWELCVPSRQAITAKISGRGELVPSWEASLALQGGKQDRKRWSQLEILLDSTAEKTLDRKISGTYTLLPVCGQAMSSLHKKEADKSDKGLPQLFFFLDPTRCGDAADDTYTFTTSTDRLNYGTERAVIARVESGWRESAKVESKVRVDVQGGWIVCKEAHLTAVGGSDIAVVNDDARGRDIHRDTATYAIPKSACSIAVSLGDGACNYASALLSCRVPLDPAHSESMWREGTWGEIDVPHQGNATFANLAWIVERLPPLDGLGEWISLGDDHEDNGTCTVCAPSPPKIHWIKKEGKLNKNGARTKATVIPFEDKLEAGRYEHALKNRPAPFVVQLRLDDNIGSFRIGLNIVSLAHRALSRLPVSSKKGQIRLSWRLTPGHVAEVPQPPRVFIIPSNKKDPEHPQPAGFLLPLRKEQLRSLWWMLQQEKVEGKTHTFVEEEISEAALPAVGWRAEGKVERPVMARGGVIADEVGYGKTVISLALISESMGLPAPEPSPAGLIDLKATLIVVPGHLTKQWPSEISRFTGKMFRLVVIQNMADLNNKSITDLKDADVILMAAEVFEVDGYWERFEYLSAQPQGWLGDGHGGRFFSDRLDTAMRSLLSQTQAFEEDGVDTAAQAMKRRQDEAVKGAESKKEAHKAAQFGKRMKGQAYRERYDEDTEREKKEKSKGKGKGKGKTAEQETSDLENDDMPIPTFRTANGTASLSSAAVRKDKDHLSSPVLHMFRFRRVIADEFTYLEKRGLAALLRLTSCYKWVLSGTPPVNDFSSIRSITAFMGIHLGITDDGEGDSQAQKARAKELTEAEKFHAFREVHSQAWHQHRDDLAQKFLNGFVRQNIAEIDEIPTVEHIHRVRLPAAEIAVYLELYHHLQALDMQARKESKIKNVAQSDRNDRLEEALADSKTAEEALLKRCCHFTLDLSSKEHGHESAHESCHYIAQTRHRQLDVCTVDLVKSVNQAVAVHTWIRQKGHFGKGSKDRQHFLEWVIDMCDPTQKHGDPLVASKLMEVLKEMCGLEGGVIPCEPVDRQLPAINKGDTVEDVKWQLREQSHLLRKLQKEYVSRYRSLRFFEMVRKIQQGAGEGADAIESACVHSPSTHPHIEMAVLSCCGHVSCYDCMVEAAKAQQCVSGPDCDAPVRETNIVRGRMLGIEGQLSSGRFGAKLERLVALIRSIPAQERILVFVQWDDLMRKVSEALSQANVSHAMLSGAVKARSNTLDKFQASGPDAPRVLLLDISRSNAAGSNLTNANHAIFLGPLLMSNLFNYRAAETQAIGRIRRYGQQKLVHIHRLLAPDTIDMTIFKGRREELSKKPDWVELAQEEYVAGKEQGVGHMRTPAKRSKIVVEESLKGRRESGRRAAALVSS